MGSILNYDTTNSVNFFSGVSKDLTSIINSAYGSITYIFDYASDLNVNSVKIDSATGDPLQLSIYQTGTSGIAPTSNVCIPILLKITGIPTGGGKAESKRLSCNVFYFTSTNSTTPASKQSSFNIYSGSAINFSDLMTNSSSNKIIKYRYDSSEVSVTTTSNTITATITGSTSSYVQLTVYAPNSSSVIQTAYIHLFVINDAPPVGGGGIAGGAGSGSIGGGSG